MAKKDKGSFFLKFIAALLGIFLLGGGYWGYDTYQAIYQPNVSLEGQETGYFYVSTGWEINDVINALYEKNVILNRSSFEWVAEKKNYAAHVKPGRYLLKQGMNNTEVINLLRSGEQEPIRLIFNNIRKKEELAGKIGRQLEADSVSLITHLNDPEFAVRYGFNQATFLSMFIPNTYELYWNTSAQGFFDRMAKEYKAFWDDQRKGQARAIGLSQSEVATLASIVQQETYIADERKRIAGVYMNRLKKKMPLQADPTLIWALGDFSIKRVLNEHKKIDSPYNTYKHAGLPPGPICLPEVAYLEAVLGYEQHNYLYFCAREDLSGYSNFAKTYRQHLVNARKYQRALNKRKIFK